LFINFKFLPRPFSMVAVEWQWTLQWGWAFVSASVAMRAAFPPLQQICRPSLHEKTKLKNSPSRVLLQDANLRIWRFALRPEAWPGFPWDWTAWVDSAAASRDRLQTRPLHWEWRPQSLRDFGIDSSLTSHYLASYQANRKHIHCHYDTCT
jgi:hypothetical protein